MHNIDLIVTLTAGLVTALVLGYLSHRFGLSPIVGYLLAGVVLGPHTPGLMANRALAEQLAEIGVILLMFGVGLHFHVRDLLAVRKIAIPGAVGQIAVATLLGTVVAVMFGWTWPAGLVLGLAISVASTVVLARVLTENQSLDTPPGHIAVGWLIVEDIFTVLILVVMPALANAMHGNDGEQQHPLVAIGIAALKVGGVAILVLGGGRRFIPWLLGLIAKTGSRELFTLSILALVLAIATGSAVLFGVSMALGAFLAGMVVGQTEVSHQAAADALPMRDAFAVLFFVSVGMLFNPAVVLNSPGFLLLLLAVVLVAKPLTAFFIVWVLRYSVRSALTVAIGLAQIGEFSFLLANEAVNHRLLPPTGQSLLVACALVSITLSPLLFRAIEPLEMWCRRRPKLWAVISHRSEAGGQSLNQEVAARLKEPEEETPKKVQAVVVGYGPVGQTVTRLLKEFSVEPIIMDLNLDTVRALTGEGQPAIYGDATRRDILETAGIREAKYLLVTIPDMLVRTAVILTARELNPKLRVFARARYIAERAWLEEIGATEICTEEAETAVGLAILVLRAVGADEKRIQAETEKIQRELGIRWDGSADDADGGKNVVDAE